jgi:hypothetical protein
MNAIPMDELLDKFETFSFLRRDSNEQGGSYG